MLAPEHTGISVICPHLMRTNIHEHRRLPPARCQTQEGDASNAMRAGLATQIKSMTEQGMDPIDAARCTLNALRNNRASLPCPRHDLVMNTNSRIVTILF